MKDRVAKGGVQVLRYLDIEIFLPVEAFLPAKPRQAGAYDGIKKNATVSNGRAKSGDAVFPENQGQ